MKSRIGGLVGGGGCGEGRWCWPVKFEIANVLSKAVIIGVTIELRCKSNLR